MTNELNNMNKNKGRIKTRKIKFITYSESEGIEESDLGGMGGFFENGMRWDDYKSRFDKDLWGDLEILRSSIIKNDIRITGHQHQHSDVESVPVFEDGKTATYSYRAWGDLMAAIWSTKEDKDYNYMDFYM